MAADNILKVQNLEKYFPSDSRSLIDIIRQREQSKVHAVDGYTHGFQKGESVGIIGESGCGKSTLLNTLIGLLEPTSGEIIYNGKSHTEFNKRDWLEYRSDVQIIFQDPFNSLDPKFTIRDTLLEPLKIHDIGTKDEREEKIHEILERVELDPPERYLDRHPERLSGGEKQRVAIARALILEPSIVFADEPVSMLDVSTQSALLNLIGDLVDDFGVLLLYISHDLTTVSMLCDSTHVMYLGRVVEKGPTDEIIANPKHPYTEALVNAIPIPDPHNDRQRVNLKGTPGDPIDIGEGCRFRDRCPEVMDICEETPADLQLNNETRTVACHLYDESLDGHGTDQNESNQRQNCGE